MLDEAYNSCDGIHLTPFSQNQLNKAWDNGGQDKQLYYQMRTFNHVLSSLRIHVERAFGQLVRRWGILWKSLDYKLKTSVLIIMTCVKLYNICVNSWIRDHGD